MAKFKGVEKLPDDKRQYDGPKSEEVVTLRMSQSLMERLDKIANQKNRKLRELIEIVLDQYCQYEDNKK